MFDQNENDIQMLDFIDSCGSKTTHWNSTIILKIFLIVLRLVLSKVKYQKYKTVKSYFHSSILNLVSSSTEHCKVVQILDSKLTHESISLLSLKSYFI